MEPEKILAMAALGWLIVSVSLMSRSIRRGRELSDALALHHPALYQELGQPRPGYFESVRRNRFARFVGRREFVNAVDASLAARFEAYRKSEMRSVLIIIGSGAVIAMLILAVRHFE
jgi:hypothetical protein